MSNKEKSFEEEMKDIIDILMRSTAHVGQEIAEYRVQECLEDNRYILKKDSK